MHSWPLYLFTLAIQSAVGGCIMLAFYNRLLKKVLAEDVLQKYNFRSLVILAVLSIAGLAFSFLDLGYPLNAVNAIANFGTSWLSREILFTVLFIALICICVAISWKKQRLSQPVLIAGGLVGLLAVFAMGALYHNTIFEAWSSVNTFMGFYGSSLILGTVVVNLVFLPVLKTNKASFDAVKRPTLFVILAVFIIQFAFIAALGSGVETINTFMSLIRWLCSALAALMFVYLYFQEANKKADLIYVSFALMLIGELIGKYLFYLPLA